MSRYYTSIVNDRSIDRDADGQLFDDVDAAIANAIGSAVGLLGGELRSEQAVALKVLVEDDLGRRVATVSVMGTVVR